MQAGDPRQSDEAIGLPPEDAFRRTRSAGRSSGASRERAQRELLLWAIAEAVAAKGYEAARVQDVVERSGLSRSTFYKHFHDKEECFFAAYDAAIESIWERLARALAGAGNSAGQAEAGLRALIGPLTAQPAVANLSLEIRTVGAVGREHYDRTLSRFAQLIADASGDGTGAMAEWSAVVAGGVASTIGREVREGRGAQLESLLPELMFTVLLPCLGVEGAMKEMHRGTQG
jgi:AcrR family transcriptional regulator